MKDDKLVTYASERVMKIFNIPDRAYACRIREGTRGVLFLDLEDNVQRGIYESARQHIKLIEDRDERRK